MIKLGTRVTDVASKLNGMLIHYRIYSNGNRFYNFQPSGLNPETGQPLKRFWVTPDLVHGGVEIPEPQDLHTEVLSTEVTDRASGFSGVAAAVTLHINGCVHVLIRPAGVQKKSGEAIEDEDFDIRLLEGKSVPKFTETARDESRRKKPSPVEAGRCGPKPA